MVYILLLYFLLILSILLVGQKQKWHKIAFLLLFFSACALISGLRDVSVGIDTVTYHRMYHIYSNMRLSEILRIYSYGVSFDIGYSILIKLCSFVYDDYYFFQLVISIIYYIGMARFFYHSTDDLFTASIIFLGSGMFFYFFNVTRQMLAVIIVVNGWIDINQKKRFRALLAIFVATTIHSSSIVFLIAYLISLFRSNKKILMIIPALILYIFINYQKVISWVYNSFSVFDKYEKYIEGDEILGIGNVYIVWMIVLFLSLYIIYRLKHFDGQDKIVAILSLIYVTCSLTGLKISYIDRIGLYFLPFIAPMFISVKKSFKSDELKLIYNIGLIIGFVAFYLHTGLTHEPSIYQFYFQ